MSATARLHAIGPAVASGPESVARAIAAARSDAPYLAGLLDTLEPALHAAGPPALFQEALQAATSAAAAPAPEAAISLRRAKAKAHLAIAIADLAGLWTLQEVTGAMTAFADAALQSALSVAALGLVEAGDLAPEAVTPPTPGVILIAMGKHGAGELNYSSDIDFSVFFDRARLPIGPRADPARVAVRLTQAIVRLLEEITVDGYVFRTDLRLRPDPGSTPVAVSVAMAEHYYQTLGQNWERAAFIKARAAAGDRAAGEAFLASLTPFIWRRHLDYAAIADVRSIKRQILTHKAAGSDLEDLAPDVKLGRGGIRDIELFVQTQQLILGGRNPALRARGTIETLRSLVDAGALEPDLADRLTEAYVFLRGVEHRAQMLHDAHTHRVPEAEAERGRLARLAGFARLEAFDQALRDVRRAVADADATLFHPEESLADPMGRLAFTGVEDDPGTLETLRGLGFAEPERVTAAIRGWHHGRTRATRTERARELLTALTPRLLRALAAGGAADLAFERFAAFFADLPAGVQLLSLLERREALLGRLVDVLTLAPRLSEMLASKPATLDALLDPAFFTPLAEDPPKARAQTADAVIAAAGGFEAALDAARRWRREEAFRIDVHAVERLGPPEAIAAAHADLADQCVRALARVVSEECAAKLGPAPGPWAVAALGKFGGRELAHGSDLDLMVVYDAPLGAGAAEYFARLTQRLITALSAPTGEGGLYDVDMQLRPSGSKGPVAVRLTSFERYYAEEAWTWELMALTRLRVVAGEADLALRIEALSRDLLSRPRGGAAALAADALDMRARMERERPGKGLWDLKLPPGGLVDIEFAAQTLQLLAAQAGVAGMIHANTGEALGALQDAGLLAPEEAETFCAAWRLYSALQLTLRAAAPAPFAPEEAGAPLRRRLAEIAGEPNFQALEARIAAAKAEVRAAFLQRLARIRDGTAAVPR